MEFSKDDFGQTRYAKVLKVLARQLEARFASEDAAIIYDLTSGRATVLTTRANERDSLISMAFSPSALTPFSYFVMNLSKHGI